MADRPSKAAASKATAAKTPPSPQDAADTPVPQADDVAARAAARAAQPTPAIAGVTAPAVPLGMAPVAPQQVRQPEPFLSEGMRNDLQDRGFAIDPVSGARFDRDPDSGDVTMRKRLTADAPAVVAENWGDPVSVEVPFAPQPAVNDTDAVETGRAAAVRPAARVTERPAPMPSMLEETGETLSYDPATGVTTAHDPATGETRVVTEEELREAKAAQDNSSGQV